MSAFAIIVDFHLRPDSKARFRELINVNARESVTSEKGCQRFDVLEPHGDANRVVLYEVYDDRAALAAHMRTTHFAEFDRESRSLVADKSVEEFELVCNGG